MHLLSLMDTLVQLDRELFRFINSTASAASVDWLFKALRYDYTWVPLYAFVLYWVITRQKRFALQFILFTLVAFAITDWVSASVLKPAFARLRPCHDPALRESLRDLVGCGGQYGMPSSHASNHFALASLWYFSIKWMSRQKWWWLWLWAAVICYAQVYVGKHYPGDIIVGAIFGTCVGVLLALLFRSWLLNSRQK